jgi:serine/threonine protein kinase
MSSSIVDELIGQTLQQRYQIRSQLGKKAGRRTLLALDTTTDIQVVIKLLIFDRDFDWQDLKLFEREAETLKSLEHPAIPRYLDYFEFDLGDYRGFALVQTHIEAGSLDLATEAGRRWSEAELKQLAQALLKILDYLHSQSPPVIHRDLKPSNILITNRSSHHVGDVYLVDFGSVQNLGHRDGGTMTIVGTYGYMPPEQFGGKAFSASDLYSLGATLIYLVTGKHPADLTNDDGKIHFTSDYLSANFIYWLNYLTEPILSQRCQSVAKAATALDLPTLIVSTIRPGSIATNSKFTSTFTYAVLKTIITSFMTVMFMCIVSPLLVLILGALAMSLEWLVIAIPISIILIFAAITHLFD